MAEGVLVLVMLHWRMVMMGVLHGAVCIDCVAWGSWGLRTWRAQCWVGASPRRLVMVVW